jgi:pilus assembly protein CpaF
MTESIGDLFADEPTDAGAQRMFDVVMDPQVSQMVVNGHRRVFVTYDNGRVVQLDGVFASPEAYLSWLNSLLQLTDAGVTDVSSVKASVIEGSFSAARTNLYGSIHIATVEVTRTEPLLTVRKQPKRVLTLDDLTAQGMMSTEMRMFMELAVRGRAGIIISGSSGSGKTTFARALSWFIDPNNRVLTAEEIDELHLNERLPNVAALTTYRVRDDQGRIIRETSLEDLVRESLRMRADRIWVGETRGKEALALVLAANSGHDGCVTTLHADDGAQAIKQLVTYVMMGDVVEEVARDQVARAFNLVVQIQKMELGQRRVTEITELEPTREGSEQRRNVLWQWVPQTGTWVARNRPSARLAEHMSRHNVNLADLYGPAAFRR